MTSGVPVADIDTPIRDRRPSTDVPQAAGFTSSADYARGSLALTSLSPVAATDSPNVPLLRIRRSSESIRPPESPSPTRVAWTHGTARGKRGWGLSGLRIRWPRRLWSLLTVLVLGMLLGLVLESRKPQSKTLSLLKQTGWVGGPSHPAGKQSAHMEPISLILLFHDSDLSSLEVTRSILRTTVGPYELIAVFGDEPHSVSQAIVDQVVTHHRAADVDRLGRGLVRYGSLNMTTIRSSERPAVYGLQRAKYEHVVLVNGNDKMLEYGWDRVLLMGMKSHPDLLAVSGRAAANLYDHRTEWALVDEVGVFGQEVHDVEVSVPALDVRDVAVRSPVMYSASKVARLGGLRGAAEAVGLGDVDLCLRGRLQGWMCAYYPIPTWKLMESPYLHHDPWTVPVPGTLVLRDNLRLPEVFASTVDQEGLAWTVRDRPSQISAIARLPEDIPKTIVTAFSGNHQLPVRGLYRSLIHSPNTRFVAYRMPVYGQPPIDPANYADWLNTEMRTFDFNKQSEWVNVSVRAGEYAWKAMILEEVVRDFGGLVLWLDSGDRLKPTFGNHKWREIADLGIFSDQTGGAMADWFHPAVSAYMDTPDQSMTVQNCNGAIVGVNSHHSTAISRVIRPWFQCSRTRACIAPLGSNRDNHRQDQSALTALIWTNGFHCEVRSEIDVQWDWDVEEPGQATRDGADSESRDEAVKS